MKLRPCRLCGEPLIHTFVDLGMSPFSNHYLKPEESELPCSVYPLHAYVCGACFLVQLAQFEPPESIFGEYAYFSSFSDSWLKHARNYTEMMIDRFALQSFTSSIDPTTDSSDVSPLVVEIACNDGYLLQFFQQSGIRTLGIEPARNVAAAALDKGIPVVMEFFGMELAHQLICEHKQADVLIGNNVLAHVPDLHDFVAGLKTLLKDTGVLTMEFPHLLQLMEHNQFDTIYHEHFSYFSLHTVQQLFAIHGLAIFDVDVLDTHGGSLRIYAGHVGDTSKMIGQSVHTLLQQEVAAGLRKIETYLAFSENVAHTKRNIWQFLIEHKNAGRKIAAYGAPAKGNTLLNYCGIGKEMVDYVVDRNPYKQGLLLPGSLIPIFPPEYIRETKPDIVIIMPWNLKQEIAGQLSYIRDWGGQCAVWIPQIEMW
ncbi:class I SAM-dependent methyltransferase [Paenibacillus radicis (ex Xue et al. 2023)]|uniref:Class I SAM-dependent methyltransferase n=1 Tax=Paenibacillus radicis (ex Xue et al. 2023) TaxID=2972489 RepID=A0ABT1YPC9_9BACL|nr:class I SAM-dependent methyltransferase [Paenibacillus radicis (ex Xue et al. 2023)]MCR8635035.1 class I SAM-dependent methyltransferase [Paenibacillus radicis (ex Xue et al. 2023)]